jgi:hypothetical protein
LRDLVGKAPTMQIGDRPIRQMLIRQKGDVGWPMRE